MKKLHKRLIALMLKSCPSCGKNGVTQSIQRQRFYYGAGVDQVELEAAVPVWTCPSCEEEWTDEAGERARHDVVCHFLGRLTPDEIRAVRERYSLSQEEWAARTGIGSASIKRWETGALIQSASADNLLRLLAFPENLSRLDRAAGDVPEGADKRFRTSINDDIRQQAKIFQLRNKRLIAERQLDPCT